MSLEDWVRQDGRTVKELAATLGVGRVALHRAMAGTVMPRPPTVRKIEDLTGGLVTSADLTRDYRKGAA